MLAGHPKLKNNLRRPTRSEIGYRTTIFSLEGVVGSQREQFLMLKICPQYVFYQRKETTMFRFGVQATSKTLEGSFSCSQKVSDQTKL